MEIGTTGLGAVEEPSGASAVVVEDTFDSIALPCDQPGAGCACLGSTNTCGGPGPCWKHRHHLSATVVDKVRGPAASLQRASKLCVLLSRAGVVDHMACASAPWIRQASMFRAPVPCAATLAAMVPGNDFRAMQMGS